jgi:hypothetical protein
MSLKQTQPQPQRLIFQGSIVVDAADDARRIYEAVKYLLNESGGEATLSGHIMQALEPCCGSQAKFNQYKGHPPT